MPRDARLRLQGHAAKQPEEEQQQHGKSKSKSTVALSGV
jgi:hypothetical protein